MPKAASNEIIPPYSVDWKSKLSDRIFPGDNVLHFTDHSLDLRPKIMTSVTSTWTPRASHNVALTIEDPTTKGKLRIRNNGNWGIMCNTVIERKCLSTSTIVLTLKGLISSVE